MPVVRKLKDGWHIHRKVKYGTMPQVLRSKMVSADDAMRAIQSCHRVFIAGNCAVPLVAYQALLRRAPELENVELFHCIFVGPGDHTAPAMQGHLRLNTAFISGCVREAVHNGRADFTPCFLSEIPLLFRKGILPLDVAILHVSPPDKHGFCSLGVETGLDKAASQAARIVIAEMNEQMPRILGDSFVHISEIDFIIPSSYPLAELRIPEPNETTNRIAQNVASLIEDGSTIQTGIGDIPNAVLRFLKGKRDLGVHTELFSDGLIELVEKGVVTGDRKTLHPGKIISGFVLGTKQLYDFVNDNPIVELHPIEYVNDPFIIAQNEKMVAINGALEVDLTGQICADSIGHKIYSGVGGQVDFIYGASRSEGGKPIIALPSTAVLSDTSRISRIVHELKPGASVTTSRNHVYYVVTEFGIAHLYGKTIRQRARALISVAHPDFREELERKARELMHLF
jgi:acetyl-CoA hydrolase